ncbi:MAG: GTP-binding protein Obg/CgtA, GTP-binding protein [Candidatus Peregrinibacteria bacterium GW2011_GWE2_39_6]|nr:MAG: GTP-binding protein Obg/CgtA, GTP-binding protein [Candidatus Peregrinibacteria bacterium GW2011_GWE2_39_6]
MFCDQVSLILTAGSGGNGCISFRREKYVPRGGPDGGDGGHGGSIVIKVNSNLNSLFHLCKKKKYTAEFGYPGARFNKAGRVGEDLVLEVPQGTLLYNEETNELIKDFVTNNEAMIFMKVVSSIRQAPKFAEQGETGASLTVRLEMRLVAEIGIIGLPSVGKSTLISRITDAKPKIADYPFTTLIPNIGVVEMSRWGGEKNETFVVADIPGLIEGAHKGKGLGDEFLRHISRTAFLIHVLDCQSNDLFRDYKIILNELMAYDPVLALRPQLVVINKIDTLDSKNRGKTIEDFNKFLKLNLKSKAPQVLAISAVTGDGLKDLIHLSWKASQKFRQASLAATVSNQAVKSDYKIFRPHLDKISQAFEILKEQEGFRVKGKRIEQIADMSDFANKEALARIDDIFKKMGILKELKKIGAKVGDKIMIGDKLTQFRG